MASVEANQMLAVAAAACDDKKAEDIRILALDPTESGLTDYFLICTGSNDRQTVAITDEIEIRLKRDFGTYPNSVEGRRQGEWILMDYVDFIVHVFLPEKRAYYGLERLRPSATTLSVADLNAEVKAAITANRVKRAAKGLAGSDEVKAIAATADRKGSASKTSAKKVPREPKALDQALGTVTAAKNGLADTSDKAKPARKVAKKAAATKTVKSPAKKSVGSKRGS